MNFTIVQGDTIRAYDFKPMKGRKDCFIEGTVLAVDEAGVGFKSYKIEVEVDAFEGNPVKTKKKTNRVGQVAYVPYEVSFMEYNSRILNLSE